jgi:hypothetical protein
MVSFASSKGRHLCDSFVDSHEVGVLRELGDDFSRVHPLRLTCYSGDRHEALLMSSVHPVFDLVKCFREVPYGEARRLHRSFCSLLCSRRAFLSSLVSCAGAWQTNRLLRYIRISGQGVSLRVPASRR